MPHASPPRCPSDHGGPKMVSRAWMNRSLRGPPVGRIRRGNVLTTSFDRQAKAEKDLPLDGYDVILANPPFSGRIDRDRIVDDVKIGTSTATELLFVKYMIDNLVTGGRCGVIVPEGVLFGSTLGRASCRGRGCR